MSDDLEFIVIDDIPEYIFCIGDDEENEQVIALSGKDGAFKYEKVAELPTIGEDGVLYLVPKSHTTQTASGNPINVNITDNAGKIESLKLDGDTFQQSYTGKNLFPSSVTWTINRAFPNSAQGEWANWAGYYGFLDYIEVEPDTTYTFSNAEHLKFIYGLQYYDSDKNWISGTNDVQTFTTPSNCHYIRGAVSSSSEPTQCQLELGASATSYEPFVGGVPSPNPDYPQPIQTVTGEQTVSINGTDYPISLGSIELCKLGTYQDYIYKSGSDWKVHKATGEVTLNGSETWITANTDVWGSCSWANTTALTNFKSWGVSKSALFKDAELNTGSVIQDNYMQVASSGIVIRHTGSTTVTAFKTWLESAKPMIRYQLATATDTTITDTNLIAQLEAVRTASLETGTNTISNTATGTNLAGDLEIGYYGYDPLNKYDKYFWLDIDGGYESL